MFEKIINEIQSVSAISEKIVFRLVNTKMNESVLKERPHRKFLDLSSIYFLQIENGRDNFESLAITDQLIKMWNIEESELWELALKNMLELFPPQFTTLESILMTKLYGSMINEIMQTREMNLRINTIIRKDIVEKLKEKELTKDGEIKIKFLELCQKIPKNRMNYGNKEMRQYRAMIDEISEKFLEVYSSEKYYELREILDRQSLLYTEAYGGDQGGDYKKNKLQELKEKMGNAVLKQAKDYIECMNNKVDEPNFGMKEKTNEEISIELAVLEETEDAFLINEQEQLFEEKENIEQVDETQEKEYDLRLSAKSRIDISEVLQKELEAAKTYLGGESSVNTLPQDDSREYSEDLMKYYIKSKELKRLLKQALKEKEATEKQRQIFNFIQNEAEKKNNPFVKELLGEMYIYGNLVEVDLEKAREYFSEPLQ